MVERFMTTHHKPLTPMRHRTTNGNVHSHQLARVLGLGRRARNNTHSITELARKHMLVGLAAPAFPATAPTLIQMFGIFPAVITPPTCMGHNRNLDDTAKKMTWKDMTTIEEVPSQQTAPMIISHDQCTTVTTTKVVPAAAVTMTEATILVDIEAAHW
jgi:hypothetical protein